MPLGPDGAAKHLAPVPARAPIDDARAPTAQLLTQGGDHRIRIDGATGLNPYGYAPSPDDGLVAFGSSTASTISGAAFAAADRLRIRLAEALKTTPAAAVFEREMARVRAELLQLCGLEDASVEVLLSPSGTDLHMLAAQLVGSDPVRPTLAIIAEETETGSGVPAALAGRRYSAVTPFEDLVDDEGPITGALAADVISVAARAADGRPRDPGAVDLEVERLAADAAGAGRRVLLVVTDVSKTGLITPTPAVAKRLAARWPDKVVVLVDASQMRLTPATMQAYVREGWLVAISGSKFLTGPAFSGAMLIPRPLAETLRHRVLSPHLRAYSTQSEWPPGWTARTLLEPAGNLGLLLRWEAALEELRRFRTLPEAQISAFVAQLGRTAAAAIAASPALEALGGRDLDRACGPAGGWDSLPTIFPFLLRRVSPAGPGAWLSPDETARVHRLLRQDLAAQGAACGDAQVRTAAGLRIEMGQPVPVGLRDGVQLSALRFCIGARQIADACSGGPAAAARSLLDCRLALAKTAWLAAEVGAGRL